MGMPIENDSEHVPDFALVPVRCRINVGNRLELRFTLTQRNFQPDVRVALIGEQVINNSEVARWLAVSVPASPLVDRSEVEEHLERLRNHMPKPPHSFVNLSS